MTDGADGSPTNAKRDPVLVLITSHWVSMLGMFLLVTALITWAFVLPIHARGHAANPYIGIVSFVLVPILFGSGLLLVPLGIYLARQRVRAHLTAPTVDRRQALRRFAIFFGVTTLINVLVGTQLTYRAVERMESVEFCGQTCHVMTPEFTSHRVSPHAGIACVDCHVGEGVSGWVESKMAGTRQLFEVALNTYPRPVPAAVASGRLVSNHETCETCHWKEKFSAGRLRIISKFAEDEANTPSQTVLTMMIGGSKTGGIHGKHFGPGIEIRFVASDPARQKIPWVEYKDAKGETRVYQSADAGDTTSQPKIVMQCVDCHNRPTHAFAPPDKELDNAFADGSLPTTLPFLKKTSMEAIKATYTTSDEAATKIPAAIENFYKQSHPDVYAARTADVQKAGQTVAEIYGRNVFPEFKVGWGTYPNNLGHDAFPGCFRCHDEEHKTAQGKTITQDCSACHEAVAVEDASPEVLKTLGLADRLAALRKK